MFFLVQDIVQIEELYGDKQSFDSGAETRIAYAPNKIETAEKLARMTGKTTVTEDSGSRSKDVIGIKAGNVTVSTSKTGRDLMSADEILKMHDQDMVVFVKGKAPIYGRKAFYYENPVLQKRASIPPPKMSARLRVAASDALKAAAAEAAAAIAAGVEPPKDPWAAGRAAMRAGITQSVAAKSSAPQANPTRFNEPQPTTGADAGQGAQTDADKPRSRYADQIKPLTPEERQQVADLVASVGVVKKVESVSAF
jgi:type IV secretion system protein VirD4